MLRRSGFRVAVLWPTLCLIGGAVGHGQPVVIDNFEDGTARWIVNDSHKEAGEGPAALCTVTAVSPGCPEGGGKSAALFTFLVDPGGWATASLKVDGREWKRTGAEYLSFWLKGDGSPTEVQLKLGAFADDGAEWSFSVDLSLGEREWRLVQLPLTRFQSGGFELTDKLELVRLVQFVKAKSVSSSFFWVDNLQVAPGAVEAATPKPPVGLTPARGQEEPVKTTPTPAEIRPAVPNVTQLTLEKATQILVAAGLRPGEIAEEEHEAVPQGYVIRQSPAPGAVVEKGSPVKLTVSKGRLAPKEVREVDVGVDFRRTMGRTRLRVGGTLAPGAAGALDSEKVTQAIADAAWHLVRLRTSELIDSAADIDTLERYCTAIRAARAYPVVCVDGTRRKLLAGEELAALAEALAEKLNVERQRNILFWEMMHQPTVGGLSLPLSEALQTYRLSANKIQTLDPRIRAGGIGLSSASRQQLGQTVRNARMDFLSFHLFGTHNRSTDDADLMESVKMGVTVDLSDQAVPPEIVSLLSVSRSKDAKIFVTECGLNSIRTVAGNARDSRARGMFGAAWLGVLLTRLAGHVDEVLLAGVGDPSWGALDKTGKRFPSYWVSYAFNSYFPLKSRICQTLSNDPDLIAFAVRTDTGANVLLVNATPLNRKVVLTAKGLGALDYVRGRRLDSTAPDIRFEGRPNKSTQTVWAKGYSLNVVQFIPKRAETAEAD